MRRPEVPGFWPSKGVVWTRLIWPEDIFVPENKARFKSEHAKELGHSDTEIEREREKERD